MTTTLRPPTWVQVRSAVGAIAVDSATINLTNYPRTMGFEPKGRVPRVVVYWTGAGTINPLDYLDLQIMLFQGVIGSETWVEGPTCWGVREKEVVEFPTYGASSVLIRVVGVNCPSGTTLAIHGCNSSDLQ